jgi:hypothetical protein
VNERVWVFAILILGSFVKALKATTIFSAVLTVLETFTVASDAV